MAVAFSRINGTVRMQWEEESVSAGKIVMPSNICLCHSTNAKEAPKEKQFFSVICRQIWRYNCQNRILMGVFLADCVGMRGK